MFTYAQFADLVFGSTPGGSEINPTHSLIGDHGDTGLCPLVDYHGAGATVFDDIFLAILDCCFVGAVPQRHIRMSETRCVQSEQNS